MRLCLWLVVALLAAILVDEMVEAQRERTRPRRRRPTRTRTRTRTRTPTRTRTRTRTRPRHTCERIEVPMCKGTVGYAYTKLPNRFNHTTQLQVYRVLEHMWAMIDRSCSDNLRLLACSLFLPKCMGRGRRPSKGPCQSTCKAAKKKCLQPMTEIGFTWPDEFDCDALPTKKCFKKKANHNACSNTHTECIPMALPMCANLGYELGMKPNMFGQCHADQIAAEMRQFEPLVRTNCHEKLPLFLCGVYRPFCDEESGRILFPCRELCENVRTSCQAGYSRQTRGLPWPNKFQCHRYPLANNTEWGPCVMD